MSVGNDGKHTVKTYFELSPSHPERTQPYQTVTEYYETWLELASASQFDGQGDHHSPRPYVRKVSEKSLECGIFTHDFARVRCDDCGHDFLVAFSCKGRWVCPSCTMRCMTETAAHLMDPVFSHLLQVFAKGSGVHSISGLRPG